MHKIEWLVDDQIHHSGSINEIKDYINNDLKFLASCMKSDVLIMKKYLLRNVTITNHFSDYQLIKQTIVYEYNLTVKIHQSLKDKKVFYCSIGYILH